MAEIVPGTMSPVVLPGSQPPNQPDPLQVVGTIMALKQQKQTQAQDLLKMQIEMVNQGMPVDPKEMERTATDAGLGAFLKGQAQQSSMQGGIGNATPNDITSAGAAAGGPPSGYQSGTPVTDSAARKSPAGGQTQPAMGVQGVQSGVANAKNAPKPPATIGEWVQQAQSNFMAEAQAKGMQRDLIMSVAQTQMAAVDKFQQSQSPRDLGAMLQILGMDVNPEFLKQLAMTPDQFSTAVGIAAGNMSPAERQRMRTETILNLQGNEPFMSTLKNQNDVTKVAEAFMEGKPIPPDVQRTRSISEVAKRAELYAMYSQTWDANPQTIMSMVDAAMTTGSPVSALPANVKSIAAEKLAIDRSQLTEQARHSKAMEGIAWEGNKISWANVAVEAKKLEAAISKDPAAKQAWEMLEGAARAGVELPDHFEKGAWETIANSMGGLRILVGQIGRAHV